MKLLLINGQDHVGFDANVNRAVLDQFAENDYPWLRILDGCPKSILNGGFSAVILLVHGIEELAAAARLLNKRASDNERAQI